MVDGPALPFASCHSHRYSVFGDLPTTLEEQMQKWKTPAQEKSSCLFPLHIYYPKKSDSHNTQR